MGSGWAPRRGKAATQLFPKQVVADAGGQTQRQEINFWKEETLDWVKWIFQSIFDAAMKQESGNWLQPVAYLPGNLFQETQEKGDSPLQVTSAKYHEFA